jgi:hypothetical protein
VYYFLTLSNVILKFVFFVMPNHGCTPLCAQFICKLFKNSSVVVPFEHMHIPEVQVYNIDLVYNCTDPCEKSPTTCKT